MDEEPPPHPEWKRSLKGLDNSYRAINLCLRELVSKEGHQRSHVDLQVLRVEVPGFRPQSAQGCRRIPGSRVQGLGFNQL